MTNQRGYESYCVSERDAQIAGAAPVQLMVVLMNGLLDELARVRAHIDAKRYEQKGAGIAKCIQMFNGLTSMLDADTENDTVKRLDALYAYCTRRINEAGFELDTTIVDEIVALVTTLRDAWASVEKRSRCKA
ncbi:flagellar export chaperone FliS [Burkholderia semiarida]|uniref:Flagellar secretion chaperone FliS n=1 Tax=Burkholderia semiarida TaxID=2843303 RepID=A0ABW7LAH6_9BURK